MLGGERRGSDQTQAYEAEQGTGTVWYDGGVSVPSNAGSQLTGADLVAEASLDIDLLTTASGADKEKWDPCTEGPPKFTGTQLLVIVFCRSLDYWGKTVKPELAPPHEIETDFLETMEGFARFA